MTIEGLKYIISHSEGTEIEYKKSQTGLARSVYETICAFLNRRGGHVVLGAKPPTNHQQTTNKPPTNHQQNHPQTTHKPPTTDCSWSIR